MSRPVRNKKAPVPLYVPDEDIVFEDDISGESGDESIASGDDMSVDEEDDASGPNEYVYDDFVVPDDASDIEEPVEGTPSELDDYEFSDSEEDSLDSDSTISSEFSE